MGDTNRAKYESNIKKNDEKQQNEEYESKIV